MGFGEVALGQIRLDQRAPSRLTQGLARDRGLGGVDRVRDPTGVAFRRVLSASSAWSLS